jgi:hypothetical protein
MKAKALFPLLGLLTGCLQADPAYLPVSLPQPYASWPEQPADTPIEPGMPVTLDPRQQEAVVNGVLKWMKEPGSASFGSLRAVKHRLGRVVVCGEVNGRNSAGAYPGMVPFIGILMGTPQAPEFVVVNIAQAGSARAEVQSICQQSGIF